MLGRNVCLAALIAVAVQVTAVHAASSICSKAEECYVNGSSSKVCNRTEKKCNRCLSEKQSESWLSTIGGWTEYNCYAYTDGGECPSGTTECPATLTTTTSDRVESSASSSGSEEAGTSNEGSTSTSTSTATNKKSSSSSSDSSKSTSSSSSTKKKKATTSSSSSDSSSSSSTSKTSKPTTKPTTKKTTKTATSSSSSSSGSSADGSTSASVSASASASAFASASTSSAGGSNSSSQSSAGRSGSKDMYAQTSSVSATVAPNQSTTTKSTTSDTALNDGNSKASNTASADNNSSGMNWGLVLGVVGGTAALVAVAGFVVWKKKQDEGDSGDEEAAFSPNKPTYPAGRTMAAPPSASIATTAYTAQPNYNYGDNYSNNYGESNYNSNYASATSTQYAAGAGAAGMIPASYGSPSSIDIDDDSHIRRTDSILGGTGVMSSTTSSQQTPFEFSGGPSPAGADANRNVWGNEASSFRQKRTASDVSVEF